MNQDPQSLILEAPQDGPDGFSRRAFLVGLGAMAGAGAALLAEKWLGDDAAPTDEDPKDRSANQALPPTDAKTKDQAAINASNADVANKNASTENTHAQTRDLEAAASNGEDPWRSLRDPAVDIGIVGAAVAVFGALQTAKTRTDTLRQAALEREVTERTRLEDARAKLLSEEDASFQVIRDGVFNPTSGVGAAEALLTYTLPGRERYYDQVFVLASGALQRDSLPPSAPITPIKSLRYRNNMARAMTAVVEHLHGQGVVIRIDADEGPYPMGQPTLEASNLDLSELNVSDRSLSYLRLNDSSFARTVMYKTKIYNSSLHNVDAQAANMPRVEIFDTDCTAMSVRGANLSNARIYRANLVDVNWDGAIVTGAIIDGWGITPQTRDYLLSRGAQAVNLRTEQTPYGGTSDGDSPLNQPQ